MWQELRDYWLPLMLFGGVLLIAMLLLCLVAAAPHLLDAIAEPHEIIKLFAADATVRRSSIAGAIGLIVTAFVFFRPNASVLGRKSAARKSGSDTMAGA
jgi:hypothetical protein